MIYPEWLSIPIQTVTTNPLNSAVIEFTPTEVSASDNAIDIAASTHSIEMDNANTVVEGYKKEYSIVGDGLYASISYDEAPTWLTSIIDTVVDYAVAGNLTDYMSLTQDVRDAISMLDVAANKYVEEINFDASVDRIVASHLTTFNATLGNTYATLVGLDIMVADINYAMGMQIEDLRAAYIEGINSEVTSIRTAYADADSALTNDITTLTSVFTAQESNLSGVSDAVESIQTYVGLTDSGTPDGTGLLSSIEVARNQLDGVVEYYFFEDYNTNSTAWPDVNLVGAANEAAALTIIKNTWNTTALQRAAHGNIVYFKTSTNAYWYNSSTLAWEPISDTAIYEAVKDAASALAAADGKISQFYAWGGTEIPADYTYIDFDGNAVAVSGDSFQYWFKTTGILYRRIGSSWIVVSTTPDSSGNVYMSEGDSVIVFDPITRDLTVYTFSGTTWYQTGTNGITAKSAWAINLENDVTGETGHTALALSDLKDTSFAYANDIGTYVENRFAYTSTIAFDGVYYTAGFGLTALGTSLDGTSGTEASPHTSEFWINADKFKFTNTAHTEAAAPFTIDASGTIPLVSFNGVVSFSNVSGTGDLLSTGDPISDLTNDSGYTDDTTANAAQGAAEAAQADATASKNTLIDIAADSKITPVEKLTLKPIWDAIVTEARLTYGTIILRATAVGVSDNDFAAAYSALYNYLITTLSNVFSPMTDTTTISRSIWDSKWNTYYDERTKLLNAITTAAQDAADDALYAANHVDVSTPIATNNDLMAQRLGYTNYSTMIDAANAGHTIISGGAINTALLTVQTALVSADGLFSVDMGPTKKIIAIDSNNNYALMTPGLFSCNIADDGINDGDYVQITPGKIEFYDASDTSNNLLWENGTLTLPNACVKTAHIGNAAVETLQIGGHAVTASISAYNTAGVSLQDPFNDWKIIQTVNMPVIGVPVYLSIFCNCYVTPGDYALVHTYNIQLEVLRDADVIYSTYIYGVLNNDDTNWFPFSFSFQDTPSAGNLTYTLRAKAGTDSTDTSVCYRSMYLQESRDNHD